MHSRTPDRPDLSIVIPTWNNKSVLAECLASIDAAEPGIGFQVIVVDNGSEDGTEIFLGEKFPEALIIRNEENLGFARACNQGIRIAEGRYILLLNNDTLMKQGTLERLVAFMDAEPAAGLAAPRLMNPDGSLQQSACMAFMNLRHAFFGGYALPFPLGKLVRPMAMPEADYDRTQEAAWVTGACMIVRKAILDDVGLLDENIFMYIEDMEWCYRFHGRGWKIFLVADAAVVHSKHVSSRDRLPEVFRRDYVSKKYFFRKHRSRRDAALFSLCTLAGSLLKLPIHLADLLLQGRSAGEESRAKLGSHWHVVKFILSASGDRVEERGRAR